MRYYKYLDKYPSETIANIVGVKPATVKRWKRKGEIPAKHKLAIRQVRDTYIAPKRVRKKTLYDRPPSVIADFAGVDVKTVRKWRRQGDIPVEYRHWLVDSFTDPNEKRLTMGVPKVERKTTKHFRFRELQWEPNGLLTDSSLLEILRRINEQKLSRTSKKQLRVVGTAVLSEDDELRQNYQLIVLVKKPGDQLATTKFYSKAAITKKDFIEKVREKLEEQLQKSMTINEITIYERDRLNK